MNQQLDVRVYLEEDKSRNICWARSDSSADIQTEALKQQHLKKIEAEDQHWITNREVLQNSFFLLCRVLRDGSLNIWDSHEKSQKFSLLRLIIWEKIKEKRNVGKPKRKSSSLV